MWIAWKQDKTEILQMNILKKGKKQDISNWYFANQEGNKNIKMHEMENIKMILLCSRTNCSWRSQIDAEQTDPGRTVFHHDPTKTV